MYLIHLSSHDRLTRRFSKRLAILALILAIGRNSLAAFATPPEDYLIKMRGTPDLMQTLNKAEFRGDGNQFCAPVAVSNSLMWLGSHGYPQLFPKAQGGRTSSQIKMVHILASEEMMNTDEKSGTVTQRLMRGVDHYVENCGYNCSKLFHQGWKPVSKQYRHERQTPDLEWMKSEFANDRSAVWWNVGWYNAGKKNKEYKRIGGHWLTLIGYRRKKERSASHDVFVLHDPASRAGKSPSRENVLLKRIEEGMLVGSYKGLPHSAKGYYLVGGGMHVKKTADFAILDGVVVFELTPQ